MREFKDFAGIVYLLVAGAAFWFSVAWNAAHAAHALLLS